MAAADARRAQLRRVQYGIAYAKQARADLAARRTLLDDKSLPACQHLHMLQMACEKLCKAHLCGRGSDPDDLRTTHAHTANQVPLIAQWQFGLDQMVSATDQRWMLPAIRKVARRIELLAPAVEDGGAVPANVEYPWDGPDGTVRVPAEHDFGLDLLNERVGRTLLKLLDAAADDLIATAPIPA